MKMFFCIILNLLVAQLFAQTEHAPNPILPAPTAAALGKYGETPVSNYTGIPQIAIPLYELKGKVLNVPISLSYNAGGIRTEYKC